MLSHEEQEKYLISRIGNPVNFTYPEGEGKKKGKLVDRVVCFSSENEKVVYWNLIDLIRFENEDENWLQITYYRYRKRENEWNFAGQTSLTDPYSNFVNLFTRAVREKDWIRPLFKKVYEQC